MFLLDPYYKTLSKPALIGHLKDYIRDEHRDKKKAPLPPDFWDGWEFVDVDPTIPSQTNGEQSCSRRLFESRIPHSTSLLLFRRWPQAMTAGSLCACSPICSLWGSLWTSLRRISSDSVASLSGLPFCKCALQRSRILPRRRMGILFELIGMEGTLCIPTVTGRLMSLQQSRHI